MKRFLSSCACLRCVGFAVGVAASIVLSAAAGLVSTANAGLIAVDDFSNYTAAPTSLNGQAGSPVPLGFAGTWTTPASAAVVGGALTTGADGGRSYRPFATTVTSATGTLSISFLASIPAAFSAIEFAPNADNDQNSIRIATNSGSIVLQGKGFSASEENYILHSIDGSSHTYSIDLNPATQSGQVRYDTASWVPFAFTNVGGFAMNYLSVANFSGSAVTLDNFSINDTVPIPEPSTCAMALAGLACGSYSLLRRRRAR
jgi:hypothetical protein